MYVLSLSMKTFKKTCVRCGKEFDAPVWRIGKRSLSFCGRECIKLPPADRLQLYVNKGGPLFNGIPCWIWTASKDTHGYGKTGRNIKTHRLSWEVNVGPIPPGLCVLHKCDNPPCCNPQHLFLGTKKDNSQDMSSKNRHRVPRKLTQFQVNEIRKLKGTVPQHKIAIRFGVTQSCISRILSGDTWERPFISTCVENDGGP